MTYILAHFFAFVYIVKKLTLLNHFENLLLLLCYLIFMGIPTETACENLLFLPYSRFISLAGALFYTFFARFLSSFHFWELSRNKSKDDIFNDNLLTGVQ